jgi:hypothetical protein
MQRPLRSKILRALFENRDPLSGFLQEALHVRGAGFKPAHVLHAGADKRPPDVRNFFLKPHVEMSNVTQA